MKQNKKQTQQTQQNSNLMAELEKAKDAVRWLLDHPHGLVDMHGLAYWAQVVETLRERIARR